MSFMETVITDGHPLSRQSKRATSVALAGLFALMGWACVEAPAGDEDAELPQVGGILQHDYADLVDGPHADHHAMHSVVMFNRGDVAEYFDADGIARFDAPKSFQQVGMRLDAVSVDDLETRSIDADGAKSDWKEVTIYWSEGILHNGHITFEKPVERVELRGIEELSFAEIEFFEDITVRDQIVTAESAHVNPQLPSGIGEDDQLREVQQAVAPSGLVTTRHQWDAISPDKVCGDVVAPYRASLHHTASPDSDGGDPHARMRGMQSYHMNTLNWCDIGYHFVVAQSGEIMQGRSRSDRPGAHVGGQNAGNVGLSMIGNYTSATPPDIQINNVAEILQWVHDTHGVPLNRDSVRGHREWPGQSTQCPGNQGLGQLDEIIGRAADGDTPEPEPEPDPEYDVDLSISIDGLDNFYTQGTSESVPDAFGGEEFSAHLLITNNSSDPIRGVSLGYAFDSSALEATDYVIETDHPDYDQSSWTINSANDAPENPATDALGDSGTLTMHAFSPGETKRVAIKMNATQYNIGVQPFPEAGIQAWMHHIDDVYETQDGYDDDPDTNLVGDLLRSYQRIDILSPQEWLFQAGHGEDLEGWTGGEYYEELSLNTNHDALALNASDAGASILSPQWTAIDADRFDEMILRVRSHDGLHTKALYWKGDGQEFDDARSLRFEADGDGEFHTLVVPVGEHREWSGTVERLLLVHPEDLSIEEDDSGWYDVDHIYFQDQAAGITSSDHLGVIDEPPVSLVDSGGDGPGAPDMDTGGSDPDTPGGDHDSDDDGEIGDHDSDDDAEHPETEMGLFSANANPDQISVNDGCAAVGSTQTPPTTWLLMLLALGLVALRRR